MEHKFGFHLLWTPPAIEEWLTHGTLKANCLIWEGICIPLNIFLCSDLVQQPRATEMGEVLVPRLVGRQMWKDAFDMHVVNAGTEHSAKPSKSIERSYQPCCPSPTSLSGLEAAQLWGLVLTLRAQICAHS